MHCPGSKDATQEQHLADVSDVATTALQDAEEQPGSQEATPGPVRSEGGTPHGTSAAPTLDTSPEVRPHMCIAPITFFVPSAELLQHDVQPAAAACHSSSNS